MKIGDRFYTENLNEYEIVKFIGSGGQGKVYEVKNTKTSERYAFKLYTSKNKNYKQLKLLENIKKNTKKLLTIGKLKDKKGNYIETDVFPLEIYEENTEFGYIMELVDTTKYINLKKSFFLIEDKNCEIICQLIKNITIFFKIIHHSYGLCYKDLNEENIYFNLKNGSVKIIDNENIGDPSIKTIVGTPNYLAPEIINGKKPDFYSDRFSLAVYLYRLLIGAYPFDGPYQQRILETEDEDLEELRKLAYGKEAIFSWHPVIRKNCYENRMNPQSLYKKEYKTKQEEIDFFNAVFTRRWYSLPIRIRDLFTNTFVTNLNEERKTERTTELMWYNEFDSESKKLRKCPYCGKMTFNDSDYCFHCLENMKGSNFFDYELQYVRFKVLSKEDEKKIIKDKIINLNDVIRGKSISNNLADEEILQIVLCDDDKKTTLKIINKSNIEWRIKYINKNEKLLKPGNAIALEPNMHIIIITGMVQLNVKEVVF